jgi:hypothetical protein
MSLTTFRQRKIYEGAAARYRALLANTRDPTRRQMLEEMIARELDAANRLDSVPPSADVLDRRF